MREEDRLDEDARDRTEHRCRHEHDGTNVEDGGPKQVAIWSAGTTGKQSPADHQPATRHCQGSGSPPSRFGRIPLADEHIRNSEQTKPAQCQSAGDEHPSNENLEAPRGRLDITQRDVPWWLLEKANALAFSREPRATSFEAWQVWRRGSTAATPG